MAATELALEARARRAYELGRLRWALRSAPLALAAGAAALACGRPLALTCGLTFALLVLSTALAFAGGPAGRAVGPGLAAGFLALAMPLLMATLGHACFGPECMRYGLPICMAGGALGGLVIARSALRAQPALRFVAAAAAVGALTGALGCTIAGAAGVLGMLAGAVLAGAPLLAAARR
ncbi:MAG TPA: hypothetical protein VMK66_10920, partial [Myxococcales bacterium]|nr:hypothetical protein [Myxococcales bacterium]